MGAIAAQPMFLPGRQWHLDPNRQTHRRRRADDFFGFSVAISGDTAMVGAYQDDDAGSNSGSAYIFTLGPMALGHKPKLTAADAAAGDWFGYSVAILGDTAIVGAMATTMGQ